MLCVKDLHVLYACQEAVYGSEMSLDEQYTNDIIQWQDVIKNLI